MAKTFKIQLEFTIEADTFPEGKEKIEEMLAKKGFVASKITAVRNVRSAAQNNAMHLWFTMLAEEFNKKGLDVKATLSETVEHDWSAQLVKELMWKPIQKSMFDKKSTAQLSTDEVTKVYETINRFIGVKFGIHVPFPSIEALMEDYTTYKK